MYLKKGIRISYLCLCEEDLEVDFGLLDLLRRGREGGDRDDRLLLWRGRWRDGEGDLEAAAAGDLGWYSAAEDGGGGRPKVVVIISV